MSNLVLKSRIELANSKVLETPVVIANSTNRKGLLKSHIDYLVAFRHKSMSWRKQSCKAMLLLLDYTDAMNGAFPTPQEMFSAFSDALFEGTLDMNGDDKANLNWIPRKASTANTYIDHVTRYSEWLCDQVEDEKELLNPKRWATKHERICNLAAYHHRKNRAFLSHTFHDQNAHSKAQRTYSVQRHKAPPRNQELKRTDINVLQHLIEEGFWRYKPNFAKPEQLNLRNVLITMLMVYGGLRISEPFHIYVDDLYEDPFDPESMVVKVCNPIDGDAPDKWRKIKGNKNDNREDYLKKKYGLIPRNNSSAANYHAGFKSEAFSEFTVHWFPTSAGVLFKQLITLYLSLPIYRVPDKESKYPHPFLFKNQFGAPASEKQFRKAYENALRKLGYDPSRFAGNNPHGTRHNYASTLTELDVSPLVRKKALHHVSLESQQVYQSDAENKQIRDEFEKAGVDQRAVRKKHDPMAYGFDDVDPLGFFSGLSPMFKR
tara:strand:+ start:184 stop:1650 length:1467 start_codon:yes stop_codon:yes gene_type:complete